MRLANFKNRVINTVGNIRVNNVLITNSSASKKTVDGLKNRLCFIPHPKNSLTVQDLYGVVDSYINIHDELVITITNVMDKTVCLNVGIDDIEFVKDSHLEDGVFINSVKEEFNITVKSSLLIQKLNREYGKTYKIYTNKMNMIYLNVSNGQIKNMVSRNTIIVLKDDKQLYLKNKHGGIVGLMNYKIL